MQSLQHRKPRKALRTLSLSSLVLLGLGAAHSAQAATPLGVCDGFYKDGYLVKEGKNTAAMKALAKPAKGKRFAEPNFGTCEVRATVHDGEPPSRFARNDYSRRQAFNADNTYFIVNAADGWWHLYNARTLKYVSALSPKVANPSVPAEFHLAGDAEPHWDPSNPNILYYVTTNGGTKLLKLDVRTNSYSVAADFRGKLPSWGASAAHIWTKSEGSPSADGRYWGFQAENGSFGLLGYFVWDLKSNKLVGSYQSKDRPDHVSMSASGRWFVTSSDTAGTWAWAPDFKTKKLLHHKSEHSDMALGKDKHDLYVSVDYQSSAGDVFYVDVDKCPAVAASATLKNTKPCPRTVLFPTYVNGAAAAMHFSGKSFSKPGWVVMSTYATSASRDGKLPWYANKVQVVELKANPRVYQVAYTHRNESISGYWSEPQASVSRDLTRIAYNSNWGGKSAEDIDTYLVTLPPTAIP